MPNVIKPFRWDITRREQLGNLVKADPPETPPGFEHELLTCCARVIAFGGDSDIVFVGRSPHSLFDLLSGLLLDTSWQPRLSILGVSLGWWNDLRMRPALRPYLEELGLTPDLLARRMRPAVFVDVVSSGSTLGHLIDLLNRFSREDDVEWAAVARKIRLVGLTWREKTSPNTWRWQQHRDWLDLLSSRSIKNVSVEPDVLSFLASGPKTSISFTAGWWGDPEALEPLRDEESLQALALGLHLFDFGRARKTRLRFARILAQQTAMRNRWFRSLVLELKR